MTIVRRLRLLTAILFLVVSGLFAQNPTTGGSGIYLAIASKSTSYHLTRSDYTILMDTTGGNRTATLPPTPINGEIHNIKKIATANTLTIDGNGNTIDGTATITVTTLNQSSTVQFLAGSGWYIL